MEKPEVIGAQTVEVYKTNVFSFHQATALLALLQKSFPKLEFNFDLTDQDRILRVKGKPIEHETIVALMNAQGFSCEPLPD